MVYESTERGEGSEVPDHGHDPASWPQTGTTITCPKYPLAWFNISAPE